VNELFPEKEISKQNLLDKKIIKEKMIKNFERKFESKTETELKKIADDESGFVEEAKIASKNILKQK
jgi:hypothetical protein